MEAQGVQLCQGEGLTEYFRDLVGAALDRQRVAVDELTAYYVVRMLTAFARSDAGRGEAFESETPLALRLARAREAGGAQQRIALQQIGDAALFLTGFFPDRLRRSPVDVDYFAALGEHAYASLSRLEHPGLAPVFGELADRFDALIDVLGEVSERTALSTPHDLLRLYERWLRTGSVRSAQRLIEQGVLPTTAVSRRIQ